MFAIMATLGLSMGYTDIPSISQYINQEIYTDKPRQARRFGRIRRQKR